MAHNLIVWSGVFITQNDLTTFRTYLKSQIAQNDNFNREDYHIIIDQTHTNRLCIVVNSFRNIICKLNYITLNQEQIQNGFVSKNLLNDRDKKFDVKYNRRFAKENTCLLDKLQKCFPEKSYFMNKIISKCDWSKTVQQGKISVIRYDFCKII